MRQRDCPNRNAPQIGPAVRRGDPVGGVPHVFMRSLCFEGPPLLVSNGILVILARFGCGSWPCLMGDATMLLLSEHPNAYELGDRLHDADIVTAELMSAIIGQTCRRFPSLGQTERTARIERLIEAGAWTDAALALIDLELPLWQVRRIAYDEGEWYCALSRERELPDWLDRSIEARHADLSLGVFSAVVDAQRVATPQSKTSVPTAPRDVNPLYESVCCDNFG